MSESNPFPEFHLFPRLEKVANFIKHLAVRTEYVHPLDDVFDRPEYQQGELFKDGG